MTTLLWHDYETFGLKPARARLAQFAGIRTDLDFNILEDPLVQYCKLSEDSLPHPGACLVTGITPQIAEEKGVCEAEFAATIYQNFNQPDTCTVGYNSVEFDDEFTRHMLYRNLYNPYGHHNPRIGNSRWDLINVVRLVRALRPDGIVWPTKDDGSPTTRLDQLTVANGIPHNAHEALGDVEATIALAKLMKAVRPKLYNYAFDNRGKKEVLNLLGFRGSHFTPAPVIHISSIYGAKNNYLGIIYAIAKHPEKNNSIIVVNLREDPTPLIECASVKELQDLMFTKKEDKPEGAPKIPLYEINVTRCPVLCALGGLRPMDCKRLELDIEKCFSNMRKLIDVQDLKYVAPQVYRKPFDESDDPDLMLYGGDFIDYHDKDIMRDIHEVDPTEIEKKYPFDDPRLNEMVFRYRARNYPETLDTEELKRWKLFRIKRLRNLDDGNTFSLADYFKDISERLAVKDITDRDKQILYSLEDYGKEIIKQFMEK